ncbi:MAG: MTAP family purine nucleoside phosphorylase [Deltaproteobacteria bacterium]|nr:MTAP family purine nucleoside phosphorylase [Deltaproteobacteria bacterium]
MTKRVGLIGGTVFYHKDFFKKAERRKIDTSFGQALVVLTDQFVYVPRHGLDEGQYILPHNINHPANLSAIKSFKVKEVIGINSTGSLKLYYPPGTVVLPHDYVCLSDIPTTARDKSLHIIPELSREMRLKLIKAAAKAGVELADKGVYWQTSGPRLETKAEIRFMAGYADLVGMTMASEATVAQELGLDYASLCSVDNYAHGLVASPLTQEEIQTNATARAEKVFSIIKTYLDI